MSTFLNFIRGILPTMKMLVKLTPTTVDDDFVNIIDALLNNPAQIAHVKATLVQHGAMKP